MGYLLLGISFGTLEGVQASLLYLIIYMINTINIWTLVISLERVQKTNKIIYLSDLNYIYKTNPLLAFIFAISLFSMAGIPPLAGFFSKFYIFLAALENGSYFLLFTGILTSVISAFYYIRIIKSIFFESKNQSFYLKQLGYKNTIVLMVSTSFLILFIFVLKFFIMLTNFVALILIN